MRIVGRLLLRSSHMYLLLDFNALHSTLALPLVSPTTGLTTPETTEDTPLSLITLSAGITGFIHLNKAGN
jgi:hypothetical protein